MHHNQQEQNQQEQNQQEQDQQEQKQQEQNQQEQKQQEQKQLVLKKALQQPRQALQVDVVEEIVISKHYLMYALYNIC